MDNIEQLTFQLFRLETLLEIKCKELALVENKLAEVSAERKAIAEDLFILTTCTSCLHKKGNHCTLGGCGPANDKPDLWIWRGTKMQNNT